VYALLFLTFAHIVRKYLDILLLIKRFTLVKIINHLKLKLSFYISIIIKKPIIWGNFESISIEPTNLCNLQCIECPTGTNSLTRKKGEIELSTVKNIIDNNKKYLSYLILYFQGEPFLNKNIFEMISYANKNNIFTYTSTNGHYLNGENCEKIIISKLDKIIISVDGTNQETYEKYRKNGNLNTVIRGIENLIEAKKKYNSPTPYIELQFLVFKHNQHQIEKIKQLGKQLRVNLTSIKTAQFYNKENYNLLTDIDKYSRYKKQNENLIIKKKIKNRCWRMWHSAVITISGDIIPCCFDKDARLPFSNLDNSDINAIRKSENYKNFAQKILSNRSSINICNNCNE